MDKNLVAPCGLNCNVCSAHLRSKNTCSGCTSVNGNKLKHALTCAIRNCTERKDARYCLDCGQYPCLRIKNLHKRYKLKYATDLDASLKMIKSMGEAEFMSQEEIKWKCKKCGGVVCIHKKSCLACAKL